MLYCCGTLVLLVGVQSVTFDSLTLKVKFLTVVLFTCCTCCILRCLVCTVVSSLLCIVVVVCCVLL